MPGVFILLLMKCPNCGYLNKGGPYCEVCATQIGEIKEEKKKKRVSPRSKKNKQEHDEEKKMRKEIWEERPPFSCIYREFLESPEPYVFGHVLAKKSYPGLRLVKRNIVLFSWEEHQMWDKQSHSSLGPEWDWLKMYAEMLKQMYYGG